MKVKNIVDETTNRYEFNRAYKQYLERTGKIHCSYCKYHHSENRTTDYYGGFEKEDNFKYPNWKLVSKKSKQWMKKPLKIERDVNRYRVYLEYGAYITLTW